MKGTYPNYIVTFCVSGILFSVEFHCCLATDFTQTCNCPVLLFIYLWSSVSISQAILYSLTIKKYDKDTLSFWNERAHPFAITRVVICMDTGLPHSSCMSRLVTRRAEMCSHTTTWKFRDIFHAWPGIK